MKFLTLILTMALMLSACSQKTEPNAEPAGSLNARSGLANTEWRLVSFGAPGGEAPVVGDSTITLKFGVGRQMGGFGGCNSYGGEYQVEDNLLSFSRIISTKMACADQNVMQQEQQYFQVLQSAARFEIEDDELTIYYDNGRSVLNFIKQEK